MTLDEVKSLIAERGIKFFLCSYVEMSGAPKAKLIPATHIDDMADGSAGFAGFAAGDMGQSPHDPDMLCHPDFNSILVLPWRPDIAWVSGNIHVNDVPWHYGPRTILQQQLAKAEQAGYLMNVGTEAEFMLLKEDEHGGYAPWDALDTLDKPCYDVRALYRNLDVITTLVGYMQELGWGPYASDHEDATCQFELNWLYADGLTTADRHTFFRWMVKTVAEEHGLTATFMPKPIQNLTGNGAHCHVSLWDNDNTTNLFLDEDDENGLSQLAYWFTGGVLHHARALTAVTCPIVNSYKRLIRGQPRSGATWAPVYGTYGGSNRTQMIRIPDPGRIENRIVDGATNPYLAYTVLLAAGLDGIANQMDPGPRNDDNLYELDEDELRRRGITFLPTSLPEALDELDKDDVLKEALGREYADYFIEVKREEWNRYHLSVSQWELDNYIGVF